MPSLKYKVSVSSQVVVIMLLIASPMPDFTAYSGALPSRSF